MLCLIVWTNVSAQSIKGVVTSQSDGEPMVGAVILEKGTDNVATADIYGNYSIKLRKAIPTSLIFRYVGCEEQEIAIKQGQTELNVELVADFADIDAVVAVGYGTVRKSDLTGAVATVSTEDLKTNAITNADQMLQGTVSGVQVTQNSGAPGGAASIRIRGASSISSSNEPLYVIDGIPFSGSGGSIDWAGGGTQGQTTTNPLSTISPQDIISMDVLKDASATAIYGSAGANGVVIINTRRGSEGAVKINYDGQVAMQTPSNYIDVMNLNEYAQFQKENSELYSTLSLDESFQDPSLLGEGTDWQDAIFRTAPMYSHSLSISGGTDKLKLLGSVGYMDQEGIIYGSDFKRYSTRFNADGIVNKYIKAGGSLAFTRTDERLSRQDGNDGVIMQALTMQPSVAVYGFDGEFASPESIYGSTSNNPLWLAEMQTNTLLRDRIMGNFYVQVDPMEGLNVRSEFGYDVGHNTNKSFIPTYDFGNGIASSLNQMYQKEEQNLFWIWKNYVTYFKQIGKHTINAMGGFEMQKSAWEGTWLRKSGFSTNDILVMTSDGTFDSNNGWKDAASKVSAFGRVNYNYDERYLLTATIRADASSKFGPANKWGYFPSAAFAWRASNEEFLKDSETISNLKLRLGYGMVGNDNIATYQYGSTMNTIISPFGGSAYRVSNISNPNLKWEASEQYNVGVDFGMFNSRVSLTLDLYQKETKDLLMQVSVPSYLGIAGGNGISAPFVNIGKTRNQGVDVTLNLVPVQNENFYWTSDIIFSKNVNEVLALNDDSQIISGGVSVYFSSAFGSASRIQVGEAMGVFYGYQTDGYFTSEEDVLSSPVQVEDGEKPGMNLYDKNSGVWVGDIKFKDRNGDGVIDDNDKTIIGDPNPDFTFGWNNKFVYKNWDLSIGINGSYGGDILNIARYRTESLNNAWDNQSTAVIDRCKVEFDASNNAFVGNAATASNPRFAPNDINGNNRMSDRWLEDGSYLRIQNVTLSYNFPKRWLTKAGIESIKLYGTIQNLYTFTNYSGYDPEIGAFNQSALMQGYDMGRYPTPRMFILGLNFGI